MSAEAPIENMMEKPGLGEVNGKPNHDASRKERPLKRAGVSRFEPYGGNPSNRRFRVFVSNIPFDVKWQALKDLMKEKGNCHCLGGWRVRQCVSFEPGYVQRNSKGHCWKRRCRFSASRPAVCWL